MANSYPTRQTALEALKWAGRSNPGPWTDHVRFAALAAEAIAAACGLDADKAYVLGLLHDIGRYPGRTYARHLLDGYRYCMERGWTDVARICLTHSFPAPLPDTFIGWHDVSAAEKAFVVEALRGDQDDYDRLIQLCDALADSHGFCIAEVRWIDVLTRYGWNDGNPAKWRATLDIKRRFDEQAGRSIYELLPGIDRNLCGAGASRPTVDLRQSPAAREDSGVPDRQAAQEALEWAGRRNPGPWIDHTRNVARAAEVIAAACGLDADKAYALGLLHDVGRYSGPGQIRHTVDGYRFCMERGWAEAAHICLTHSFPLPDIRAYSGRIDVSDGDIRLIESALAGPMNDFDRLIQLCDALADENGFCIMEKRWIDVVLRHGWNDRLPEKWRAWRAIKARFDESAGQDVYALLPGIRENSLR